MRRAVIVLLATVAVAVGREPSTAQESPVVTSRVSEWSGPFDVGEYSVPKPKPIDIPYTLSAIYMPKSIWPSFAWGFLRTNNERNAVKRTKGQRMPLLGYYQGDSPEVLDWQIKMAVDRGITNFMFGDYWVDWPPPRWRELFRDAEALLNEAPDSEKAEALVARFYALWHAETGDDPQLKVAIRFGAMKAFHDRENWPPRLQRRWYEYRFTEIGKFLGKASMAALRRHGAQFFVPSKRVD